LPRYIFFTTNDDEQFLAKYGASLLSPTAFTFGADAIANYEYIGTGVQWDNMYDGSFSFGGCLWMMFLDFFLYGFLALYFDQVLPQEYGTPKHPFFFLSLQYWCPSRGVATDYQKLVESEGSSMDLPEFRSLLPGEEETTNIEPLDKDLYPLAAVKISELRKRFDDGKLAIKTFSMAMLEGQITCLLGSNGAGKTTTIGVLTGLIEATSGTVSIYGRDLKTQLQTIRQMTGICPQHNVLFPTLTVCEHLRLFGCIKGLSGRELHEAVDRIVEEVGLTEKKNVPSSSLSGGMKRKLSLAMALMGDPKFVLLDEPTSGMDPYSRRSTWELLQRSKAGRVCILTTHFMDEADTLGDRIAIMSEGRLRCSGSSLFLKTRYGAGYLLSMAKTHAQASVENVESHVKCLIPAAKISSAVAGEIVMQLPITSVPMFASLFSSLKEQASVLGIGSYGISITTLEQVFIKLALEAKEAREKANE